MEKNWDIACRNQESEFRDLHKKLKKQNWYVEYIVGWKGVWMAEIDEDEFHKKKLRWENSRIYYGDIPIEEEISGKQPTEEEIHLHIWGDNHDF